MQFGGLDLSQEIGTVLTRRAPRRDKKIRYNPALLPIIDRTKELATSDIVTAAMKVFARDTRVISIDSDLATTSGLEAGVAAVDWKVLLRITVGPTAQPIWATPTAWYSTTSPSSGLSTCPARNKCCR
jgi:hypothetical protein